MRKQYWMAIKPLERYFHLRIEFDEFTVQPRQIFAKPCFVRQAFAELGFKGEELEMRATLYAAIRLGKSRCSDMSRENGATP